MGEDYRKYKSHALEGDARVKRYAEDRRVFEHESTHYTPAPKRQFKGIDDFHHRAENTAFRAGDSYHQASRSRDAHNMNYIGHFKNREQFDGHERAGEFDEETSEMWHAREKEHRSHRPVSSPSGCRFI